MKHNVPYSQYDYRECDVWAAVTSGMLREVESGSLDAPDVLICGSHRAHPNMSTLNSNWVQASYVERA